LAVGWPKHKQGIAYLFYFCELRELPRSDFALILGGSLLFEFSEWEERRRESSGYGSPRQGLVQTWE
jgi:hypothetical protein